jgi:glucose/arabinose dehydrogenase
LNAKGQPVARESLLSELKQRIADVRQGPDGLLYLVTDESAAALLRLEPIANTPTSAGNGATAGRVH